jgi:hypothetical protein
VKAGALLRDFRRPSRTDDNVKPYLASDEDVFDWMTEAERQACLRARLIYDETTRDICRVPVVPGRIRYNLDPRIREVADVWVDRPPQGQPTSSHHLVLVNQNNAQRRPLPYLLGTNYNFDSIRTAPGSDYGNTSSGWNEALQEGNCLHQASVDGTVLSLYTIPDQSFQNDQAPAVLRLCVYRLPLKPITGPDDCFEIPELYQDDGLIHWLLYRFFDGNDPETADQTKAQQALAAFTARYGPLPDADAMRQQQENQSNRMAYAGY